MRFWQNSVNKIKAKTSHVASKWMSLEFNQTRFDAALAWMLRSRVGIVILNVTSISILLLVKILKKAKSMLGRVYGEQSERVSIASSELLKLPLTLLPEVQDKPRVLIIAEVSIPQCLHYRVKQKVEQLEGLDCYVEWHDWSDIEMLRQKLHMVDLVLFYRVPAYPRILELMRRAKALKKLVVYDVDDLIFDRAQLSHKFQQTSAQLNDSDIQGILDGADLYKSAIQQASYGIASTPALQREVASLVEQGKCYLLPNGLDHTISEIRNFPTIKTDDERVTIFYGSGTKTHDEDFATISQALSKIMTDYDFVHLTIVGHLSLPLSLHVFSDRIQRLPLMDFQSFLYCLKHADIAIAPLESGKFADCKSEIKWLEAACFAVPAVVTKTARYEQVIEQGKTGFMAEGDEQWLAALSDLVSQSSLRKKVGLAAQGYAQKQYGCNAMANQMQTLLSELQTQAVSDGLLSAPKANIRANKSKNKLVKHPLKRVLLVNVLYPPQAIGGATTVVTQSVEKLVADYADQFHVSILTTEMSDEKPYSLREYEHNGVSVTVMRTPFHSQLETREQDHHILSLCHQWFQQNRPNLIHFHSVQRLTGSAVEAARQLGIPYLVTVHDAWWISEHQFLLDANDELVNSLQLNPLTAATTSNDLGNTIQRSRYLSEQLRAAQKLIGVSDYQSKLYHNNGFENIITLKNGVSLSDISDQTEQQLTKKRSTTDQLVIGYLGGLSAHKGYYFLKNIVEANQFTHLSFTIVDLFKPYGFSRDSQWGASTVQTLGKFSAEHISEFYQGIDILIAPSIWPESFGLVTREAALYGVWVIAADAGGMAEDVLEAQTGLVFPMGDSQACQQILANCQRDFQRYKKEKPNVSVSQQTIFSMDQHAQQLTELYLSKLN